jgi:hypothetical protein
LRNFFKCQHGAHQNGVPFRRVWCSYWFDKSW